MHSPSPWIVVRSEDGRSWVQRNSGESVLQKDPRFDTNQSLKELSGRAQEEDR